MKFATDDDDDIYDCEYRLKLPGLKKLKYILIQYLTSQIILLYYQYKSE